MERHLCRGALRIRPYRFLSLSVCMSIAAVLLPRHAAAATTLQALPSVTTADGRLGLCNVLPGSPGPGQPTWAQLAYNAGARVNRWEFRWDRIEPERKVWDFSKDDPAVASSLGAGLAVEGILIGTPRWATPKGLTRGNSPAKGFRLPASNPHNLWADYVRAIVTRYRGEVKYWEVWNEADLSFFWSTTARDYYRMLHVAYTVVKQTDPSAKVVLAGMVVPDMAFLETVLRLARHDKSPRPFDIAAWHAYGPARSLYDNLLKFKALLGKYGYAGTPLWVTEDGFPASNPNGEPRQAAYVLQTIAYAFAAGARKVLVYRASDDTSGKQWGLVSGLGALRMSYLAFQVAARYLANVSSVLYAPTTHLQRFVFYEPGQRITLSWTAGLSDQSFNLPAPEASATTVDWQGNAETVSAAGTDFALTAAGATYNSGIDAAGKVVGGPPNLLIDINLSPRGLQPATYVPPAIVSGRRLILFNPTSSPQFALVSTAWQPKLYESLHIGPQSLATADLDLVGGPQYAGAYDVSATGPLVSQTIAAGSPPPNQRPSALWYVPLARNEVLFSNPAATRASLSVTGYDKQGRVQGTAQFGLGAHEFNDWQASWLRNAKLTLEIHASNPVNVSTGSAAPALPVAQSQADWFVLRPTTQPLMLYNPQASTSHLSVSFIKSQTVDGVQLSLRPHQTYALQTHASRVVSVLADSNVSVGSPALNAQPAQPLTQTNMAIGGNSSKVSVFNPSTQPAHIAVTVVSPAGPKQIATTVKPLQLKALQARSPSSQPVGLSVSSDLPVVATPSS